jgi:biopolymer transport protein ExbB
MLSERILHFSTMGAEWVLWLLIALSLLSLAVVIERTILFAQTREKIAELEPALRASLGKGDLAGARRSVARDSLVRNVVRAGLDELQDGRHDSNSLEQAMLGAMAKERARFDARLTPLGTIGNNAPFVGLFGTVLGIIQAFAEMGRAEAVQAATNKVVIAAIGEALVATAVGILVAIPAVAAFNWLKSTIATRQKHAESMMRAVLQSLGRPNQTTAA